MNSTAACYRTRTFCLVASIAASSVACGAKESLDTTDAFASGVFVGEVLGTDVRVGVVATAQHARVFFCGGESSYQTRTKWVTVDIGSSHRLSLPTADQETWSLSASLETAVVEKKEVGTSVTGTIDMGDGPRQFSAIAVADRTIAGLYEGMAACGHVGFIVQQPAMGDRATAQGACIGTRTPTLEQVNPLGDIVRADDGAIRVIAGTAMEETTVRPATPPVE